MTTKLRSTGEGDVGIRRRSRRCRQSNRRRRNRIKDCQAFALGKKAQYIVGRDKCGRDSAHTKIDGHGELQRIKCAKSVTGCVPAKEFISELEMTHGDPAVRASPFVEHPDALVCDTVRTALR